MTERNLTFKDVTVLSLYPDDQEDSDYRIQVDDHLKYIAVKPNKYDYEDILCFPSSLIDNLPPFPPGDWTTMIDQPRSISFTPLVAVSNVWHPRRIDILSLNHALRFSFRTNEVEWEGKTAIAKMARFEFEIPQVERETRVYQK